MDFLGGISIAVSLLGIVASLIAVKYAKHAWLDPVPLLEFRSGSIYLICDDDRVAIKFTVTAHNVSGVPAYIKEVQVLGFPLPQKTEELKFTSVEGETFPHIWGKIQGDLREGASILPGKNAFITMYLISAKKPGKDLKLIIVTPKRRFKHTISDIKNLEKTNTVLAQTF